MPSGSPLDELKYRFVGLAGSLLVRALGASCDGELENREIPSRIRASGRPVIYAVWHGRLMAPVWTHRNRSLGLLVSRSADGEYLARVATKLGFHVIRGSSTRGGEEGFRLLLDELRAGRDVAITPDGPTGPRHEAKKGIVYLARVSGAAIVPTGLAIDRYHQFPSWDHFRVMLPGAYILARFGQPLLIPEKSSKHDLENYRLLLQDSLNSITADCESRVRSARQTRHLRPRYQVEPRL